MDTAPPEHKTIILASGSPRRIEILKSAGLAFDVLPSRVLEDLPSEGEPPTHYVERLACEKVADVRKQLSEGVIIGADTIVELDGKILGKPKSDDEATEMLVRLRNRVHQVITGVAISENKRNDYLTTTTISEVYMRDYTNLEIANYINSREPFDKAGAYGVQDLNFSPAQNVTGCYLNVVGLPLCEVIGLFHNVGITYSLIPELQLAKQCSKCSCLLEME